MGGNKIPLPYHKKISDLAIRYSSDNNSLLDIGCGIGQLVELIDRKGQRQLYVADAYQSCLDETCRRVTPDEVYLIAEEKFDITEKIKRQFDIVIMSHVLEHMLNPIEAVRDALSLVNKGGHLIMAVPNPARPSVLISNISKRHYCNRGHVAAWDMSHWMKFLENILDLDVVEYENDYIQIKGCNSIPPIMKLGEFLGRLVPWWCFSNIAVIRK